MSRRPVDSRGTGGVRITKRVGPYEMRNVLSSGAGESNRSSKVIGLQIVAARSQRVPPSPDFGSFQRAPIAGKRGANLRWWLG